MEKVFYENNNQLQSDPGQSLDIDTKGNIKINDKDIEDKILYTDPLIVKDEKLTLKGAENLFNIVNKNNTIDNKDKAISIANLQNKKIDDKVEFKIVKTSTNINTIVNLIINMFKAKKNLCPKENFISNIKSLFTGNPPNKPIENEITIEKGDKSIKISDLFSISDDSIKYIKHDKNPPTEDEIKALILAFGAKANSVNTKIVLNT
jgi:hypothetical protein